MPTIELSLKDLEKLVGKKIDKKNLEEEGILFVKGEIEGEDDGVLKVDIKDTNRPDIWSVEGIARELKGHYGKERGMPKYRSKKSSLEVFVDKKVEKVRPKTVCAVIKNMNLDSDSIKQMIQLQEKVCQTFGRNRDFAAIGVYDYDKIKGPIKYTTFKPNKLKFKPLGFEKEMDLKEILEKHPKGQEYGYLLEGKKEYPIFIDDSGQVLSMPPIINSNYTGRVDENTKNVFIEVSGHEVEKISVALNVIVTALADRGGELYTVDVNYDKKMTTPDLSPRKASMNVEKCRKITGMTISEKDMVRLLEESRMDAKLKGDTIEVLYLPYRNDIMDERDLIEEIAISFGYNNIEPKEPGIYTKGDEEPVEKFSNKVREICIGFGLQEVMNYTLTNRKDLLENMRVDEKVVEIENPVSKNWSIFRNSLLPSCLKLISKNKHKEFPQKVFEIGNAVEIDKTKETKTRDSRRLAIALTDNQMGYEDICSILNGLLSNLGMEYELKKIKDSKFTEGRCASIFSGGKEVGKIGEIHPEVLENMGIETPVAAMELKLETIKN